MDTLDKDLYKQQKVTLPDVRKKWNLLWGYEVAQPETEERVKNLAFKRTVTMAALRIQGAGTNGKAFHEVAFNLDW